MSSRFASNKKLWATAGVIFVSAAVIKQTIWNKVSKEVKKNLEDDHKQSVKHLEHAYANQLRLTPEEIEILKKRKESQANKNDN